MYFRIFLIDFLFFLFQDWRASLVGIPRYESRSRCRCSSEEKVLVWFSLHNSLVIENKLINAWKVSYKSYSEFFWSFFSRIRYVYEIYWSKSRFSMRMRKNTDQKRLRIWKLFTDDLFSNLCNWFINSSQALVNYLARKENCPLFSSQFEMSQKMFLRSLWWLPILVK